MYIIGLISTLKPDPKQWKQKTSNSFYGPDLTPFKH